MHSEKQIPIWYFIGILLLIYGLLIFGTGLYGAFNPPPPEARVKLWHLHSDVWWGALLCAFGLFYVLKFRPKSG